MIRLSDLPGDREQYVLLELRAADECFRFPARDARRKARTRSKRREPRSSLRTLAQDLMHARSIGANFRRVVGHGLMQKLALAALFVPPVAPNPTTAPRQRR